MPVARRLIGLVSLAGAVGLLLAPLPATLLGPWQGKLLDFGHVPLFAALVVVLRITFRVSLVWLLAGAVVVAGAAEVVQPYVGRTRDWQDFAWGVLGALAGACVVRAWQRRRFARVRYALLALALPAWPVVEVAPYARDTIAGRRAFPVLADFSTDGEMRRWGVQQATLARDGTLELRPGGDKFSWAALRPIKSDFRGYRWLCCEFVVGDAVELVTSVRAVTGDGKHTAHAQVGRRFVPGDYLVRYDLGSMVAAGQPEPLDPAKVWLVQFFTVNLTEPRTVRIRKVWLEP